MPLNDKNTLANMIRAKEIIDYLERVKVTIASQQHTKMLDEMSQIEKTLAQSKEKISKIKEAEQDIEAELQKKRTLLEATNKAITDYLEYQKKLEEEFNKVQKNIMNLGIIREKEIKSGEKQKLQSNLQSLLQNLQIKQKTLEKTLTGSKNYYHSTPQVYANIEPIEASSLIANISESLSAKENSNDYSRLIQDIESKISEAAEQKKANPPQKVALANEDRTALPEKGSVTSNLTERLEETSAREKSNDTTNQQQNNKEYQPALPINTIEPSKEQAQAEEPLKAEEQQPTAIPQGTHSQDMENERERMQKLREEIIERIKSSHGSSS